MRGLAGDNVNLLDYIALLQTANAQINRESAVLFTVASDAIRDYAKSIEHVQSGNMRDSTVRLGPFSIGQGALETQIFSGAFYAEDEVAKGGTHDWATRGLADQSAQLQQLADTLAERAAAILTGGG